LEERGVEANEDPGNLDLSRTRNRIRHRVLPLLESELRPRVAERIARAAARLRRSLDALDAEAARLMMVCRLPSPAGAIRLDAVKLRSYPEGLIERILHNAVAKVRGSTSDIHSPLWRTMTLSLMRAREARFLLPDGVTVDLRGKTLEISPLVKRAAGPRDPIEIDWTGRFEWGARARIRAHVRPIDVSGAKLRIRGLTRVQVFDADLVRPPCRFRFAQPGDVLAMEDSAGSRKLSDLLSEMMVPRAMRAEQPVLEDAGGVLWAPGIRRAARALVSDKTARIWIVRWSGDLPADHAALGGSSRR
jgi:tRNA(Ile)-lysidine synthase